MPVSPDMSLKDRILANIEVTENGCWIWQLSLVHNGYGQLRYRTQQLRAHRVAYEAFVGEIPPGLHIDHLCKVRACVNPDHMEAVTQSENNRRQGRPDLSSRCRNGHERTPETTIIKVSGGSRYRTCRICSDAAKQRWEDARKQTRPGIARGERSGTAKLTEPQIVEIRARFDDGDTQRAIADSYGVSQRLVCFIGRRQLWRHVEERASDRGGS